MNVKVNLSTPPHLIWDTVNSEGEKVVRWYEKHANKLGGLDQLKNSANRNLIDDPKHQSRVVFQKDWTSPPYDMPDGTKDSNRYNCIDIIHYSNKACFFAQGLVYLYYKTTTSAGMYFIWETSEEDNIRDAGGTLMPRKFVVCFTSHFFLRYCDTERKMGTMDPNNTQQIIIDFLLRNRFGISVDFMHQYRDADGTECVDICLSGCVGRGKVRRTDDSDVVMYEFDTCLTWKMLHSKQYRELKIVIDAYANHIRQKTTDAEDMKANVTGSRGYLLEDLERTALREITTSRRYTAKVMRVVTRLREYVQYMIQFTDPAVNKGRDVYDYLRDDVQAYVTGAEWLTSHAINENMSPSEFEDLFLTALIQIINRYNVPIKSETVEEKFYEKEDGKVSKTAGSKREGYAKIAKSYPYLSSDEHRKIFIDIFTYLTHDTNRAEKLIDNDKSKDIIDELYIRIKCLSIDVYNEQITWTCREIIERNNITDIDFRLLYEHEITRRDAIKEHLENKKANNNRTNNNDIMNDKQITEFKALVKKQLKNFDNYVKTATGLDYDVYLRQVEPLFAIDRILPYIEKDKDYKKAVAMQHLWAEKVIDNQWCSMLEPYVKELGKELVTLAIIYMMENDCWKAPKGKAQIQSKDWDYSSLEDIRQAAICVCENEEMQPNPEPEQASEPSASQSQTGTADASSSEQPKDLIDFSDIEPSEDLHVSIDEAKKELTSVSISISRLTQSISRLTNFVHTADPDIDASQKATAELLKENESLRKQLDTKKREADTIKAERDEKQRIINALRNQVNTAIQDKERTEKKNQSLLETQKKQAEALKTANDALVQLRQKSQKPEPVTISYADLHREQPFLSLPAIRNINAYLVKKGIGSITGIE